SRTTSRSRRSRRPRAASARGSRATRSRRDPSALAVLVAVAGDRDQLLEPGLQLLVARPLEALAQHVEDLGLGPPRDEHDEAEAELLLVDLVQVRELGH